MLNNTFAICTAVLCSAGAFAQGMSHRLLRHLAAAVVSQQDVSPEAMRPTINLMQTPLGGFGLVRNNIPSNAGLSGYVEGTVKTQDGGTARYLVNAFLTDDNNVTILSDPLTVYPNPFSGGAKFTLNLPGRHYDNNDDNDRELYRLSIYNLAGEKVKTLDVTPQGSKTEISLTLNLGMYFLRLADIGGKPMGTGKIVVE